MKILNNIQGFFKDLQAINHASQRLSKETVQLQEHIATNQKLMTSLQASINKMNFKNKPHINRIQASQKHLNQELAKYKTKPR